MTKKAVSGTAREIKGRVENEVGKLTDNERTRADGVAEEVKVKAEKQIGRPHGKDNDLK
jgi:uncharacterized protein YjbJ (UPF0337 family)